MSKIEKGKIEHPLKNNNLSKKEKLEKIEFHFAKIMESLGLDLTNDSLKDTPKRVAKMYVNELFSGLDEANKPEIKLFSNGYKYENMILERNINVHSCCEHHFLPIVGKAHIAYISSGKVIGLSKLNRIVAYYSKRPQVQERLCLQIAYALESILDTKDIAIFIRSNHNCVSLRGIRDPESDTITSFFSGKFEEKEWKSEFFHSIRS